MDLLVRLGDRHDLTWAQRVVTERHYLHQLVDARARPMVYVLGMRYPANAVDVIDRVGLVMLGIPHATRCSRWWGYDNLPTQWQVVDMCRIWLDPAVQIGGFLCRPDSVPGYYDRRGLWRSTVATWAIEQVLSRVQADRVRLWPPVYLDRPYHIRLAISYHDPAHHRGTIYRHSHAQPMYVDAAGQPVPGPSGKYGWCWKLPEPAWEWNTLADITPRTLRMF